MVWTEKMKKLNTQKWGFGFEFGLTLTLTIKGTVKLYHFSCQSSTSEVPNLLGLESRHHLLCTFLVPCDIKTVINVPIWQLFWSHLDLLQVLVPGRVPLVEEPLLYLIPYKYLVQPQSSLVPSLFKVSDMYTLVDS